MKKQNLKTSKFPLYIFPILMILFVIACSKGGDDMATPNTGGTGGGSNPPECDVSNVTFSGTVWPLISANCTSCHSGASPNGGVRLEDYASVSAAAAIPAGTYGSLYGVITHNSGNANMPQNASKLSNCNISKIKAWIDAGRPNN